MTDGQNERGIESARKARAGPQDHEWHGIAGSSLGLMPSVAQLFPKKGTFRSRIAVLGNKCQAGRSGTIHYGPTKNYQQEFPNQLVSRSRQRVAVASPLSLPDRSREVGGH